ncbi:MAG: anthranilate synthase component I family protein [Vampirovibrionales bacterium]|nr:anthranilate synthase component I family protein [Vampirovibrionales bacterium]
MPEKEIHAPQALGGAAHAQVDDALALCLPKWQAFWPYCALLNAAYCASSEVNQWALVALGIRQGVRVNARGKQHYNDLQQVWEPCAQPIWALLERLRQRCVLANLLSEWTEEPFAGSPVRGGLMLYLGYEAARFMDNAFAPKAEMLHGSVTSASQLPASLQSDERALPDLLCFEPEAWLVIHKPSGDFRVICASAATSETISQQWQAAFLACLKGPTQSGFVPKSEDCKETGETQETASLSPEAFAAGVETLKAAIERGETYQANLSMRFERVLTMPEAQSMANVFHALCAQNPSPFSAFLQTPEAWLVCNSPERLVACTASGQLESRPIAGTRGRAGAETSDEQIGALLRENPKERAEHLMLVDLVRNDLGRVSLAGSVRVSQLMTLERYSHVTHLVSHVLGDKLPEASPWAVIRALFPAATITGCPKIRTVQLLDAVEPAPRGFYTGSLGYVCAQTGALDLNILIRSLLLTPVPNASTNQAFKRYRAQYHAGAGIVADSDAQHEYRECLRKLAAIHRLFDLIAVSEPEPAPRT